jgi:hypothetical protein
VGLPASVSWKQGDLFAVDAPLTGVLVATLFLHHFVAEDLARLGRRLAGAEVLAFVEPLRSRLALAEGYALVPFVGKVTRHDMIVSIRAGFVPGELPRWLGLGEEWQVQEAITVTGGYRLLATRR